ncbi:MAG TPA: alpha/beta hydrolase [Sphingobacteriaceae bacterium]
MQPEKGTFHSSYAPVNGLQMYYEVHGQGKPLVLIHGGGSTIGTTFGRIMPELARHHQVIAVELQAHGHTADIDRPLSFEQDADDLAELLKHLQINKSDIFGFSNGGTTALQLAIRHPELVDHLIVASALFKRDGAPPLFWDFMETATLKDMPTKLQSAYLEINPIMRHCKECMTGISSGCRTLRIFPKANFNRSRPIR